MSNNKKIVLEMFTKQVLNDVIAELDIVQI